MNLAEQPAAAQPGEPGTATVTAGRDQKFRGNVNIGSGVLTVNRQRNIRLGLGGALAVLMVSGVTTGVVYLRQGDRAAPQSADSPPAVSSSVAAKPLSTVPPTSLDTSIATIKMTNYTHDDTTIYGFISDSHAEAPEPDLTATVIATGQPRWSVRLPDNGVASNDKGWTPTLVTGNGKTLVAAPYYGTVPGHGTTPGYDYIGVMAVDAQTGSVAWHVEVQKFQQSDMDSMRMLPPGSLIGGGSVLAVSWEVITDNILSPHSPNTSAVVDATKATVLWKKAHFAAGAVESGVVAGYMTDRTWLNPRPVGLAAADGRQLWKLNEPLDDLNGSVGGSLIMQLAAPGVLLAQGTLHPGLGYTEVTQLLDASSGVKKMELIDRDVFYEKAQSNEGVIILYDYGNKHTSNMAAYDATSFQRLWALPDPAANRVSLDPVGALWHGALYGNGADHHPAMLDARTGADKTVTLPCVPTALVPGYALCGGNDYYVQVYPVK
ncbi:MAG: PQQ-binding-like beta-propeller repeat protein [Pseudonocardiaceae bacterium]